MDRKTIDVSGIKVSYDDSVDVLYVSFGELRPGLAVEINDGDFVRVDPYTDEVVGVTILDFHERFVAPASVTIEQSAQRIVPEILEKFRRLHKTPLRAACVPA